MVKIIAMAPDFNDGTSFYRAGWPLSRMARDSRVSVTFRKVKDDDTMGWAELGMYDVLFIQRPYTDWNLNLVHAAHEAGVKVWVDYDDDLLHVEMHNPAFKCYAKPDTRATIMKIVRAADLVTFSTKHLKNTMGAGHSNAHVVRNATDFELCQHHAPPADSKPLERSIFWRGTKTHDADLHKFADAIEQIAVDFPSWRFFFLGQPWWGLVQKLPKNRCVIIPPVTIPKYFGFLQALNVSVAIVPLADSTFNRSKSNIAWQEATLAGAACVTPAWEEWNVPGAMSYQNDSTSFYNALARLLRDDVLRSTSLEQSRIALKQSFDLRDTLKERIRLVEGLCSTSN